MSETRTEPGGLLCYPGPPAVGDQIPPFAAHETVQPIACCRSSWIRRSTSLSQRAKEQTADQAGKSRGRHRQRVAINADLSVVGTTLLATTTPQRAAEVLSLRAVI